MRRFNELKKKSQEIEQEDEEKKLILHDFRQIADRRTRAAQTALHGSLDDETVGTRLSVKPQPVNRHRVMKVSPPRQDKPTMVNEHERRRANKERIVKILD